MNMDIQTQLGVVVAMAVACTGLLFLPGAAVSDSHGPHEVTLETPDQVVEGDDQTIEVTVKNPTDQDLVFPLVEVPLQDGLSVADEDRFDRGDGTEGVNDVVAVVGGQTEDREAFINDSEFRGGEDALFIEGEEIPAGESITYRFNLSVETTAEANLEVDVRPLNNEDSNVRVSETINPVGSGTINATFASGSGTISVTDANGGDVTSADSILETDVAGGLAYNVNGEIAILNDTVSVTVTPAEYGTETVDFAQVASGAADEPTVTATSASTTNVVDRSSVRRLDTGTAEVPTTETIEFDLVATGGETHIVVENQSELPMQSISDQGEFETSEWVETSETGVVHAQITGEIDDTVSVTLTGYPVGDVTTDNEVNSDDAGEIAEKIAAQNENNINRYGDVTDDGSISVVDAMKIQQYEEGNRNANYKED